MILFWSYRKTLSFLFVFLSLIQAIYSTTLEERVKALVQEYLDEHHIPGAAIAVYYQGQGYLYDLGWADIALSKPVTPDTLFAIGSITKVFTSILLANDVLQGKVNLNDPVGKFVPGLISGTPISGVTLKQLATHTSSLPEYPQKLTHNIRYNTLEMITGLNRWRPSHPIGTHYRYSNIGFALLGFALGNIDSTDYYSLVNNVILQPLNMASTFINVPYMLLDRYAMGYEINGRTPARRHPMQAWPGGGALRSTSRDMLKFLQANLGVSGPPQLLKAMQFAQQPYFRVNEDFTMGLGWRRFVSDDDIFLIDKDGGVAGFSSYIGMIPDQKVGIVILLNRVHSKITRLGRLVLLDLAESP